jgi:hypothetical protein
LVNCELRGTALNLLGDNFGWGKEN